MYHKTNFEHLYFQNEHKNSHRKLFITMKYLNRKSKTKLRSNSWLSNWLNEEDEMRNKYRSHNSSQINSSPLLLDQRVLIRQVVDLFILSFLFFSFF